MLIFDTQGLTSATNPPFWPLTRLYIPRCYATVIISVIINKFVLTTTDPATARPLSCDERDEHDGLPIRLPQELSLDGNERDQHDGLPIRPAARTPTRQRRARRARRTKKFGCRKNSHPTGNIIEDPYSRAV